MPASRLSLHLGATVRALRKARGWPRRELATHTGISERFLADIEAGRGNPSLQRLEQLATALATTPAALLAMPLGVDAAPQRTTVALLGLRGAGKSSVGQALAVRLGCPFVELDARVEAATGLSITEIFQLHGEAYYRRHEGEALDEVPAEPGPRVLATGGGVVNAETTFVKLRRQAHTVWLQAQPEDHWTRVVAQGDTRPMADNEQAFTDLCAILTEREQLYRRAQLVVATSGRSIPEITDELALHFAFLGSAAS